MDSNRNKPKVAVRRNHWVSVYHHQVHSIFDELIHKTWGHQHWHAAADVLETADSFLIEVDLPGVDPDNIQISLTDNILIVEGLRKARLPDRDYQTHLIQRPIGKCYSSFEFPGLLDSSKMTKNYENGVLTITIPKESKL